MKENGELSCPNPERMCCVTLVHSLYPPSPSTKNKKGSKGRLRRKLCEIGYHPFCRLIHSSRGRRFLLLFFLLCSGSGRALLPFYACAASVGRGNPLSTPGLKFFDLECPTSDLKRRTGTVVDFIAFSFKKSMSRRIRRLISALSLARSINVKPT